MNKLESKTSIIICNFIYHFDINIYLIVAPVLAPIFLPGHERILQLIFIYTFLASSNLIRPVGVFLFGYLCLKHHPIKLLKITMLGVGISSFAMSVVPTTPSLRIIGAIMILLIRITQAICAEGEKTISTLYILEGEDNKNSIKNNAWLSVAIMCGCSLASMSGAFVNANNWRIPFFIGGLLSLYALMLRIDENTPDLQKRKRNINNTSVSLQSVLLVMFGTALSYVTYDFCFIFINNFIPLVTNISNKTMVSLNPIFFITDALLFIPCALYLKQFDAFKINMIATKLLAIFSIPLFMFMRNASLPYIIFVRFFIITVGVIYSCALNVYLARLFKGQNKYLIIGFFGSLGLVLFGKPATPLCLGMFYLTNSILAPPAYLAIIALISHILFKKSQE
jgi:MFS family permease